MAAKGLGIRKIIKIWDSKKGVHFLWGKVGNNQEA
jgi:hypothetical protein